MKPNNHAADKQTKEEEQDDEKEYQAERNRVISLTMRHRCAYCAVDLEETVLISPTQRIIAGIIDEYEAAKEATRDHPDQRVFFVSCPNCKTALSLALAQKKTSEVRR